jgi:hypothetical protein
MKEGLAYDLGRIRRDIIPAWQERKPTERVPPSVERTLTQEEARQFSESFIDAPKQIELNSLVASLPEGSYIARDIVGVPEKSTRHVHDFVIRKTSAGAQLFYIDPEQGMGKSKNRNPFRIPRRGDLRPQVNIIYSVELTPEGEMARISLLRYRAAVIPSEQQEMHKPSEQLQMAKSILATGTLPAVFEGNENEITFRLDFRPAKDKFKVLAQARAAEGLETLEKMIENLTQGKAMSSHDPIEGQLRRFRGIIQTYFSKYLKQNAFKPLLE